MLTTLSARLLAAAALSLQAAAGAQGPPDDTLRVRPIARPPAPEARIDSATWGPPQVRIPTGQGTVSVWLLRAADTLFVAAAVPDSTRSWADALAVYFDVQGDRPAAPAHPGLDLSHLRVDGSNHFEERIRWRGNPAGPQNMTPRGRASLKECH